MKTIRLNNSKNFAFVDDSDYALVSQFKWTIHETGCVMGWKGKRLRGIKLHRLIMDAPAGMQVDHIDHDKLNNQRKNLRLATQSQNSYNMSVGARKNECTTSKFKGVSFAKDRGKWVAVITHNYHAHFLGRFFIEEDAARAYNAAARKHFGEFACLNPI